MQHLSLIIVCGPAGGGKSTYAERLSRERDLPLVATDAFVHLPWADVPFAVHEAVMAFDEPGATCIVEGVRALSMIDKFDLARRVTELYWVEVMPEKPNTKGLTTRQRNLLDEYKAVLPEPSVIKTLWAEVSPLHVFHRRVRADS